MSGGAAEQDVAAVVRRYFVGLDGRDRDLMLSVFHDDVEVHYDGQFAASGLHEVRALFASGMMASGLGIDVRSTIHVPADVHVEIDGDEATSRCVAVAYLAGERMGRAVVVVRGLRYLDRLQRRNGRWAITARTHAALWMYEHEAIGALA